MNEAERTPEYVIKIERKTRSLLTAARIQLVVMALAPGDDIGMETHTDVDQLIRVEAGKGTAVLNGKKYDLEDGSAVVIPAGTEHNIINSSRQEPLKLYTIYSPPEHPDCTVHTNKAEALAYEKGRHQ
jgi:mannose-6-phosphate isomerase-like protein (cupin superfamily)